MKELHLSNLIGIKENIKDGCLNFLYNTLSHFQNGCEVTVFFFFLC